MKKLAAKTVILIFIILATILCIYLLLPENKENVMAAIIDKERLLKSTKSPKIVLAGGSNLSFGIDSEMIDSNFDYEVVNSALTGGMGLNYILSLVKPYLNKGDIVILAFEHTILRQTHKSYVALNQAFGQYPQAFKYASPIKDPIEPTTIYLTIQKRMLELIGLRRETNNKSFSRNSFNKYGDLIEHLELGPRPLEEKRYRLKYKLPKPGVIKTLNNFYTYCKEKGVRVYMTFPPFPETRKLDRQKNGQELVRELQKELLIPIISDPDDYLFPEDFFWGHSYHLGAAGREERTRILIEDLNAVLNENNN